MERWMACIRLRHSREETYKTRKTEEMNDFGKRSHSEEDRKEENKP